MPAPVPSLPFRAPKVPEPDDPPEPGAGDNEDERVREWRVAHLEELGLPYPLALELAIAGVDWHRVAQMVERGATTEQVAAILL